MLGLNSDDRDRKLDGFITKLAVVVLRKIVVDFQAVHLGSQIFKLEKWFAPLCRLHDSYNYRL